VKPKLGLISTLKPKETDVKRNRNITDQIKLLFDISNSALEEAIRLSPETCISIRRSSEHIPIIIPTDKYELEGLLDTLKEEKIIKCSPGPNPTLNNPFNKAVLKAVAWVHEIRLELDLQTYVRKKPCPRGLEYLQSFKPFRKETALEWNPILWKVFVCTVDEDPSQVPRMREWVKKCVHKEHGICADDRKYLKEIRKRFMQSVKTMANHQSKIFGN